MYVLTDQTPEEPTPNAHSAVQGIYLKWLNNCTMVRCIMWAIMNNEFSHKFEEVQSENMLKMLNESFGTLNDIERYKTSCTIFNAWMREEVSVIDHVLYMIEQIEHLSKLDFLLHEQLVKDAIMNFLSKSYLPFLSHYRITKLIVNYHGLLGLLQTFKKDHWLHKGMVNIVGGSSSGEHHPFKKRKKKKIKRC